jgi:hypothetical protein
MDKPRVYRNPAHCSIGECTDGIKAEPGVHYYKLPVEYYDPFDDGSLLSFYEYRIFKSEIYRQQLSHDPPRYRDKVLWKRTK